ncbi:MAG: histidine kinase [Nitrosomonadales bacterium]|nr:histidine kinase [Nitrosomonadales bacterium]
MLGIALIQASSWSDALAYGLRGFALLEPVLFSVLLLLYLLQPRLSKLPYRQGATVVIAIAAMISLLFCVLWPAVYALTADNSYFDLTRSVLLGAGSSAVLLVYFRLWRQALSPALHEARLQALRARIRPHFLFNTLNAVLGIVRSQPKRAETALEDMSDLFRMAMEEGHDLTPLRKEIELARRYLALEEMRLGERLQLNWEIQPEAEAALVPPLLLQPLLENAVYHGIECLPQGGVIDVRISTNGRELVLEIANPHPEKRGDFKGHKIALDNIRERLALLFDVEARYQVDAARDHYRVRITVPYLLEA